MSQTVQVFASTDLHGEFDAFSQSQRVKNLKNKYPDSIWIDNGDFFIGNSLTTYYNTEFKVSPLVAKANEFAYDVMIPGNHDLDYGLEFLKQQVKKLTVPYVCCNLVDLKGDYIFEPYTILKRQNQKIAVIGLMTEALPQLTSFENTKHLICEEAASSLKHVLEVLPSDIDLIVVSYHGGLEVDLDSKQLHGYENKENQAYAIASQFPQINGFVAGHQHFTNAGHVKNCAFIQPGSHGKTVGSLTFTPAEKNQSTLYTINQSYQMDDLTYEQWLNEKVNDEAIITFLSDHFQVPQANILFKMKTDTRRDFLNAFTKPFSFYKYTFLQNEWKTMGEDKLLDSKKESVTIYTNDATFPQHRLQEKYLDNLFDAYHRWATS